MHVDSWPDRVGLYGEPGKRGTQAWETRGRASERNFLRGNTEISSRFGIQQSLDSIP